eukprot:5816130-Prymnesium_polylepis.1
MEATGGILAWHQSTDLHKSGFAPIRVVESCPQTAAACPNTKPQTCNIGETMRPYCRRVRMFRVVDGPQTEARHRRTARADTRTGAVPHARASRRATWTAHGDYVTVLSSTCTSCQMHRRAA